VSTLDDLNRSEVKGMAGLVTRLASALRPVSRRSLLMGTTVAATALATKPKDYVLRPVAAYATICGPGNTAASGWTVFCATINKGTNACPPGSFAAGWWKAADSSWCGGGYRYIVDCNASCSKCSTGCSDGICDSRCWSCSCGTGSTATCDQRRICCNAFRYGQCNTQVKCSGGVHCRVVSCVAPYKWEACTTTSLRDDRTSEHSTPKLPLWSQIEQKYIALGAQASVLKASTSPLTRLSDGRGSYVRYQGGCIYYTTATRAVAVSEWVYDFYATKGGPFGALGYPKADLRRGLRDGGWIQVFEKGAITDSQSTSTQAVSGVRWTVWQAQGRESGALGYPKGDLQTGLVDNGWIQLFQTGAITDSSSTTTQAVSGIRYTKWADSGRERGVLGYPTGGITRDLPDSGWIQVFQRGAITDTASTSTQVVSGSIYTAWYTARRWLGPLRYPTAPMVTQARGASQAFQGGEIWALTGKPGYEVYGAVLTQWKAAGGAAGQYGYPVSRTQPTADGRLTCTFEGGTITA
jgi:uncharacterized protein with LGFP repeats